MIFLLLFENLAVNPCRWSQHRHAQSCDVDSGMCNFRLDLFYLFYPCKFGFVVHAKCSSPAFCMITEVKQAWWVKPEVTHSWIYNTTHSKVETKGRLVQMVDQNGSKFEHFSKKVASYPIRKFIGWYMESDEKIKNLMLWALKWL